MPVRQNQDVIITGIKCRDDKSPFIYNLVTTANGTTTHRSHFFDVSFSGTGDLFASVICGSRLNGFPQRRPQSAPENSCMTASRIP